MFPLNVSGETAEIDPEYAKMYEKLGMKLLYTQHWSVNGQYGYYWMGIFSVPDNTVSVFDSNTGHKWYEINGKKVIEVNFIGASSPWRPRWA